MELVPELWLHGFTYSRLEIREDGGGLISGKKEIKACQISIMAIRLGHCCAERTKLVYRLDG
jgi:hypothetical protein